MQPEARDRRPPIRSVDELTAELRQILESTFREISVEGEVVSCRRATSGHLYFNLKGQRATLPCVMFRSAAWRLKRPLKDGDRVICTGSIEVYPPQGRYQLVVQWLRLGGEGELLAALDALKRKLAAEGLFAAERKRRLPMVPRRIGVVTSPTGAAIQDVLRSIHQRFPARVLLAPAPVQGEGAAGRLIRSLQTLARVSDVDVIVIARGGGSLQDLWAFNDEGLARAIAACQTPVVSAVGHEIDTMLSDYVADVRAATPTGVGELVVPEQLDLLDRLDALRQRAARGLRSTVSAARARLSTAKARLGDPRHLLRERWQRLDELDGRLTRAARQQLRQARERVSELRRRLIRVHPEARLRRERDALQRARTALARAWSARLDRAHRELRHLRQRLIAYSPQGVLDRGYAIVRRETDRTVIRSHTEVETGAAVEILLGHGTLDATVRGRREGRDRR